MLKVTDEDEEFELFTGLFKVTIGFVESPCILIYLVSVWFEFPATSFALEKYV